MNAQARLRPGKYRLTMTDFLRLDEAGAFGEDRTELLDGDIVIMNAEYRPHARIVGELTFRLRVALQTSSRDLATLSASVDVSDHDMPLPDIVLTREPGGDGPIPASSVELAVEVSSTTLSRDLHDKQQIYARAGIPEYWVADVNGRVIHQMWAPGEAGYVQRREIAFGERVAAETIAGLGIETTAL